MGPAAEVRDDGAAQRIFVHVVDAEDRLISVNEPWLAFAQENAAPELEFAAVNGVSLWRFISDPDTRHLYRLLLARARGTGRTFTVRFRCDSPALRRFMRLEMTPMASGAVSFACREERRERRRPVALLDPAAARCERLMKICSWCKRVLLGDRRWVEVEEAMQDLEPFCGATPAQVTHGMCPACHARVTGALRT